MKRFKLLTSIVLAAAVAAPALSMAQDRDDHHDDPHAAQKDRPAQNWHKGDRVPDTYRDNRYVVNDWKGHHLSQPPSGYHWVQVNGDFVLAAVATGVIADVMLSR